MTSRDSASLPLTCGNVVQRFSISVKVAGGDQIVEHVRLCDKREAAFAVELQSGATRPGVVAGLNVLVDGGTQAGKTTNHQYTPCCGVLKLLA